ncbi:hypothetical protein EDB83DRAFT_2658841 [Lactarius deliciosus]|nr:hypothetical protein EDB83DRAFT_2658841 [Lactarius deliciosus]
MTTVMTRGHHNRDGGASVWLVFADMGRCHHPDGSNFERGPTYDYAHKDIPLPQLIEKRPVTVHPLELVEWKGSEHPYRWPEIVFSAEQKKALALSLSSVTPASPTTADSYSEAPALDDEVPTAFVLRMRVSGGTRHAQGGEERLLEGGDGGVKVGNASAWLKSWTGADSRIPLLMVATKLWLDVLNDLRWQFQGQCGVENCTGAWYPHATPRNASSFCFIASVRESPMHLLDASDGRVSCFPPMRTTRFPIAELSHPDPILLYA